MLVVREGLGREQQDGRARVGRVGDGFGDGELVAAGLPGRRAGGDHGVSPAADGVDRLGLVAPERAFVDAVGQVGGERGPHETVALRSGGEIFDVDESPVGREALEQSVEGRRRVVGERHGAMLRRVDGRIPRVSSDTVRTVDIVVHSHIEGSWCVLTVAGELDVVGAPELRQQVMRTVADGHRHLVLDLRGVDYVDSFGLGVLVGALKRVRLLDGDLRLVVGEPRVRRVLELCDLDRVFTLHADVEGAVA